jgi:hypothetical protein
MPTIAADPATCHCDLSDVDHLTLITIAGKKQTIISSFEAWYEMENEITKPLLIMMVSEKESPVPSKLLTESTAEEPCIKGPPPDR